jgi:hypothetical protein
MSGLGIKRWRYCGKAHSGCSLHKFTPIQATIGHPILQFFDIVI